MGGTRPRTGDEIAIIGMAGRFPRAADIEAFWQNLHDAIECSTEISADDLRAAGLDPAALDDPDYVRRVFALEDPEHFDAEFFGFSPAEAAWMDPQHRLLLETGWQALEHAGYDPDRYPGLIGVFGGVGRNSYYLHALAVRPELFASAGEYHALIGNERDFPTTHISYRLNLRGPSMDVQTACSTSGVAMHLACQSLRAGECDMALAGGAKVIIPNRQGYQYIEGGPLSPDGHLRAFDAGASGMVRGSGAAMVLLKRLEDALADGDTVHAVLLGSAVNNDGSGKIGFTAPSVEGQALVITEALEQAGVSADAISYVETHGTGTILGDPIEVAGLTTAFRRTTDRTGFCRIGSVKTNIGHLDAGATVAGLVKTVLAMRHEQLPASLNFERPNPQIDFAASPFVVNAERTPWPAGSTPRRAGLSSFGLGGTNAHLVIEEAPTPAPPAPGRPHELVLLSARTPTALDAVTDRMASHLATAEPSAFADAAFTTQVGRRAWPYRRCVVAAEAADAADALRSGDGRRVLDGLAVAPRPVAFLFPGMGSWYPGMGQAIAAADPVYAALVDECLDHFTPPVADAVRRYLAGAGGEELDDPSVTVPAVFAVEWALARLWMHWGVVPSALIGHSLGQYAAACCADVMSLADAARLVEARGALFATLPAGGLLSVGLGEEPLRERLGPDLDLAVINRADQCVASGPDEALSALAARLEADGIPTVRVPITVATHSRLVEPILAPFRQVVEATELRPPTLPVVCNITGRWLSGTDATDPGYWVRHVRETVRFADGLGTLMAEPRVLLEVGPGRTLGGFARQHPAWSQHAVAGSLSAGRDPGADHAAVLEGAGRLWLSGVVLDWEVMHNAGRRRVPLPLSPFERRRHSLVAEGARVPVAGPAGAAAGTAIEAPAADPEHAETPLATRRDRIRGEVAAVFADVSGLDASRIDPDGTFLELGFDSLSLARANAGLKRRFGIPLTTRALMERWPTLNALAGELDTQLPDEWVPGAAPAMRPAALAAAPAAPAVPDRTSPWQPVTPQSGEGAALTTAQQAFVDDLVGRVNARTPGSKAMTQQHRAHLADPRTVQGFRRQWKEMVYPVVSDRARGSRIWDVDGNEYIDLVSGYGVTFFGHQPEFILEAVRAQLERTIAIGPQTVLAGEVARLLCDLTGHERAAFCNTGSEAVLAAIRVARTVTGRSRLAMFAGHYHGIFDEVLVKGMGTGAERRAVPVSPGIPASKVSDALVLEYGNMASLDAIRAHAGELALVMVEPVRSRNPDLQPREFVQALRALTRELGIPLLFDEMITGFRSHPRGAQHFYGIEADLATYGKVVGGGFPIGIVAGRRAYLDALDGGAWSFGDASAPEADMTWFAGTFVRHPLALAAARAVLERLHHAGPALQEDLNRRTTAFVEDLNAYFRATGAPLYLEHFSSVFLVTFTTFQPWSALLFHDLHTRGVYTYEGRPAFLTLAHSDADLAAVADAFKASVAALQAVGLLSGREDADPGGAATVPLSEGQQEIWLAAQRGDDASRAYNLASTIRLRGPLRTEALQEALHSVVARHEALRAVPAEDGRTQRILQDLAVPLHVTDLTDRPAAERDAALEDVRTAEVETAFDLVRGPLVRAQLVRLAAEEHELILTVHHVVCDGWSSGVLLRDLGAYYGAVCEGRPAGLAEPMQLREFVAASADAAASPERAEAEAFWQEQFADGAPVLDLPTDRPRPRRKTFRALRLTKVLDEDFVRRMRRLAADQGVTVFGTFFAGFGALLQRLTGQDDLVVGFSLAGQSAIPDRDLVCHAVTFLPLRLRARSDQSFDALMRDVRSRLLDTLEHQNVSFGRLIQELPLPRDPGRAPLMSVVFNLDPSARTPAFHGLDVQSGSVPRRFENFDLFFNLVDRGGVIEAQCTFNLDLFDPETIEEWLAAYVALLDAAAREPGRRLAELGAPAAPAEASTP